MASSVVSADGSVIGFESLGAGPPMVLVHGGTADRTRWAPVREQLAERYTVHIVDRRGRGLSLDEAESYDIQREGEDIAAVASALGGDVFVVAHSYGALCTLESLLVTDSISRAVLYEPPMSMPGHPVITPEAQSWLRAAASPESILEIFYQEAIRLPPAAVDAMKGTVIWQARLAAAHTIVRELDYVVAANQTVDRLSKIDTPVRLLFGTESPAYLQLAAHAVAEQVPGAQIVPMRDQAHLAIDQDPAQFVNAVFAFGPV